MSHAVDGPLNGPAADALEADADIGGVAVLRHDRLTGLAVDACEAEHRVARQLKGENENMDDFRASFMLVSSHIKCA